MVGEGGEGAARIEIADCEIGGNAGEEGGEGEILGAGGGKINGATGAGAGDSRNCGARAARSGLLIISGGTRDNGLGGGAAGILGDGFFGGDDRLSVVGVIARISDGSHDDPYQENQDDGNHDNGGD